MKLKYKRAMSYAYKCHPILYRDIVHQAYVKHFDSRGTDLFDQDMFIILTWLKYIWFAEINKGRYTKDGVLHYKQFYTPSEEWSDDPKAVILASKSAAPDSEVITKEFYQELFKRVDEYTHGGTRGATIDTKVLRQFLEYLDEGYTCAEISKETGMSEQRLHYYKKKLRKIITDMQMKSPFNGDQTRVKKKITRKTFENSPEYKEYKYNPGAGCDENEFYQLVTNGIDFILIREKND